MEIFDFVYMLHDDLVLICYVGINQRIVYNMSIL